MSLTCVRSACIAAWIFSTGVGALAVCPAYGQTLADEWARVQPPPPIKLDMVAVDPAKTALLVMDFNQQGCTPANRPRCVAALPKIQRLLRDARAHHVTIVHTLAGTTTAADISPELAPAPGERVIAPRVDKLFGRMDKFYDSDLEAFFKDKGIDTVIAVGTSANGAVLYTASHAAAIGLKVIVPVDAMPADTAYQEQFTAWEFLTAPVIRGHITLTRTDWVTF